MDPSLRDTDCSKGQLVLRYHSDWHSVENIGNRSSMPKNLVFWLLAVTF